MPDKTQPAVPSGSTDDQPPILGTWNRLYALVIILHALIITLFYWFTQVYS